VYAALVGLIKVLRIRIQANAFIIQAIRKI